ncbi:MAG TPA: hypothetical protein VFB82_10000, partial [Blastocatellia bacterium]|nr:hypothetical protein [Blastocatellia bacterium]
VRDGLTAVEIARRFGVHKSQTTRILHRVEEKMRAAVYTRLGTGVIKGWAGVGRLSVFEKASENSRERGRRESQRCATRTFFFYPSNRKHVSSKSNFHRS